MHNFPIGNLGLSVRLWVCYWSKSLIYSEIFAPFPERNIANCSHYPKLVCVVPRSRRWFVSKRIWPCFGMLLLLMVMPQPIWWSNLMLKLGISPSRFLSEWSDYVYSPSNERPKVTNVNYWCLRFLGIGACFKHFSQLYITPSVSWYMVG